MFDLHNFPKASAPFEVLASIVESIQEDCLQMCCQLKLQLFRQIHVDIVVNQTKPNLA